MNEDFFVCVITYGTGDQPAMAFQHTTPELEAVRN